MTVTSWEEAADVGGLHADGGQAWTALRAWLRHERGRGVSRGRRGKGRAPLACFAEPPGLEMATQRFYAPTARALGLAGPAERARTKNRDFFLGWI